MMTSTLPPHYHYGFGLPKIALDWHAWLTLSDGAAVKVRILGDIMSELGLCKGVGIYAWIAIR